MSTPSGGAKLRWNRQGVVGELHFDVLFVHARQLDRDFESAVGFSDIDRRHGAKGPLHLAEGSAPEVAAEVLEQVIDFTPKARRQN
jgi:hypothetical protein